MSSTFGPSALVTPANAVTVARLLSTPALIAMVAVSGIGWAAFAVAVAVGATDAVDGWLARRQGATRSGAFLDPLADKVAVLGVLFALAGRGRMAWVPVALIAAREVSMLLYRVIVGRHGVSIPARPSAKLKTLVQGIAILLALAPPTARHPAAVSAVLWLAVTLTLVTGAQYFLDGRKAALAHARRAGGVPTPDLPSPDSAGDAPRAAGGATA
ncbi:MAG TPA: CDP-alcohol phosphatidyltransferase family protein [Acidimicrobiales bacterium]|nr:CDP-alcohol phosphatidyltransferase family protein [Acidimicrobiales bacterium]